MLLVVRLYCWLLGCAVGCYGVLLVVMMCCYVLCYAVLYFVLLIDGVFYIVF